MYKRIKTDVEIKDAFPLIQQLRPELKKQQFLSKVREIEAHQQFMITGLYLEEKLVGWIGYMPLFTLYYDRCLWICDLVIDQSERGKGYGEQLLSHIEEWAQEQGYTEISLSSSFHREDAHRFYEQKMDYTKTGYIFKKIFSI